MPPAWQCLICGYRGNRKGKCVKCKEPVSKTADEASRREAIAKELGFLPPNIKN